MGLSTVSTLKTIKSDKLKTLSSFELKKLQKIILDIVDDIDYICKKYDIKYNLGGGSVLGAVRHNGFIPWDDDFDIDMKRKEYDKFCAVFLKEFKNKYWLHTPEDTKNYGMGLARVRKKGTVYRTREDLENEEAGVYVDIFVVENTYNFILMRYIHGILSMMIGFLLSCRNFYHNKEFYLEISENNKNIRKVFGKKIFIGRLISFISIDKITHLWNNVNKMCKNEKSKYVTVPVGRKHFFKETYDREQFCESVLHDFEGRKLPIPKEYKKYLSKMYGDYMKIPEDADKEKHIFLELKL